MTANLFTPYKLNDTLTLSNKILMAPLTRCMADDDLVPSQQVADYYARRAEAGLIISEANQCLKSCASEVLIATEDAQGNTSSPTAYCLPFSHLVQQSPRDQP